MNAVTSAGRTDLRRAPLAALRSIDFRADERDYWADEAAVQDRLTAVWAGLDEAAWRLPGAAPSDAGGPDWSLFDHVAHVVDWWQLAAGYIADVLNGADWPSVRDYDGGDFDVSNERRRGRFDDLSAAELWLRGDASHERMVAVARQLPAETLRGDAAWGWVHQVLHGHAIDHLTVLEPWADQLRARQIGNDPFGPDPQPTRAGLTAAIERFWANEAAVVGAFRRAMATVPDAAWRQSPDGSWSLADHVAHLADWFIEGAHALETHAREGRWVEMPPEGLDAYNECRVRAAQETNPAVLRDRFEAGLTRIRSAVGAMSPEEWLDPEGFSWAYEDLHGHVRAHHAMIGPWIARVGWPLTGEHRGDEEDR